MDNDRVRVEKISEMLGRLGDPDYPFREEARKLSDDELAFLCQRHGTLYRRKHVIAARGVREQCNAFSRP